MEVMLAALVKGVAVAKEKEEWGEIAKSALQEVAKVEELAASQEA